MDPMVLEDLRYRITNLKYAIEDIEVEENDTGGYEAGYRKGRLVQMESELRFLKGLLKVAV